MTGAFWMLVGSLGAISAWGALSYMQVRRGVNKRLRERTLLESRIGALRADENRLQEMIDRKEKADRARLEAEVPKFDRMAESVGSGDDPVSIAMTDLARKYVARFRGEHARDHVRGSDVLSRWIHGRHARPLFPMGDYDTWHSDFDLDEGATERASSAYQIFLAVPRMTKGNR